MAFKKIDLSKFKEPQHVPEGEYDLRVVKVNDTETKKGEPMTVLTMRIEDAEIPNAAPVMEYITYPNGGDYDEMRGLAIKRLCVAFDVGFDEGGFDAQDFLGKTGRVMLTLDDSADDGVIRNKMRLPRLKE
jgi:hypothetical protein